MRSRTNVSTAMGLGKSGALQEWLGLCNADLDFVRSLTSQLPAADSGFVDLTSAELTAKVIKLHALGLHASRVANKYNIAFTEDDKAREQVREVDHSRKVRRQPSTSGGVTYMQGCYVLRTSGINRSKLSALLKG